MSLRAADHKPAVWRGCNGTVAFPLPTFIFKGMTVKYVVQELINGRWTTISEHCRFAQAHLQY